MVFIIRALLMYVGIPYLLTWLLNSYGIQQTFIQSLAISYIVFFCIFQFKYILPQEESQ